MLRTLAALAAAAVLAACGNDTPLIEVSPSTYDFGAVLQGEMPEVVFTLTNHSDRTVGFKATPNCSCFATAQGLRPLEPGQSQTFQVLFDTTAKPPGPVKGKWITIHTDSPDVPGMVLPLEGEIFRAYDIAPTSFNMGRIDGRPANFDARVIRIRPQSGYQVRLQRAVANPPLFKMVETPHDGGGFDVNVSIPRDMKRPRGHFRAVVRLELDLTTPDGKPLKLSDKVTLQGLWAKTD